MISLIPILLPYLITEFTDEECCTQCKFSSPCSVSQPQREYDGGDYFVLYILGFRIVQERVSEYVLCTTKESVQIRRGQGSHWLGHSLCHPPASSLVDEQMTSKWRAMQPFSPSSGNVPKATRLPRHFDGGHGPAQHNRGVVSRFDVLSVLDQ
ncbi:hypothetical protein BGZ63DRAFT_119842 [Mariannaea sp. PMI_226]|nr:hypothetical protein BGZ63DRAFT_119842 [Mariannaea sp. PMI_226]